MNIQVRRKLDMAGRVREFVRAHTAADPGYAPVLTRLDDLLVRAEAILKRQRDGAVAARAASAQRRELRDTVHAQLMHYLVAIGSVAAKDQGDLARRFRLPSTSASHLAFITDVRSLLALGEAQRDLLVQAGMSATLLDELGKMVADMEALSETARTGRRDHIGARLDLGVLTTELMEQVKVLDGITRYRFGKDPELMGEWRAARALLGAPRNGAVPPVTPPTPTPPPGGEVKAAA